MTNRMKKFENTVAYRANYLKLEFPFHENFELCKIIFSTVKLMYRVRITIIVNRTKIVFYCKLKNFAHVGACDSF